MFRVSSVALLSAVLCATSALACGVREDAPGAYDGVVDAGPVALKGPPAVHTAIPTPRSTGSSSTTTATTPTTTTAPTTTASTSTTTPPPAPTPTIFEREAVAVAADDLVDHKSEGERLLASGKVDDAIAELKRALSVDSSADVWAALGEAYLRAGTVDRGVGCLEEAVAVDVDHKAARKLLVRHYLSAQAGTLARLHAEEWVRLAPQDPAARQAMGRAFTQVGMWKEAIDEFALVVEVQPDNAFACNNLGFAALQLGENERAVQSLERVLSLKPQQGFMLNNLGVAYERVGRTAEAHAAFARAAELSPRYAQAALNRDRVQKGLDHAQRIVSTDALLRLRDGDPFDAVPLGTGPADGVLAVPGLPSFDGE